MASQGIINQFYQSVIQHPISHHMNQLSYQIQGYINQIDHP